MTHFKLLPIVLIAGCMLSSCQGDKNSSTTATVTSADSISLPVDSGSKWWAQSNIYEVNLRQYSKEGTINAFSRSLLRLKDMGVEVLWFMPVTPIGIEGRKMDSTQLGSYYAVRNYKGFNEAYGSMEDWIAFVKQAHSMGFKVITDWVANHSAPDNPWIKSHPQFYEKDSTGGFAYSFDWSDTRNLDYTNRELRDSMTAAMKFWLTETGIDGFRCDMAGEVPTDFWKDCIATLKTVKPDLFMLAEGEKPELITAGFNASYTWQAMHAMKDLYAGTKKLPYFDSILNANIQSHPANAARLFFTSNHDENSWNGTEYEKYGTAAKAFAVLGNTFAQAIPLIYSGQELPNKKRLKFFVKDSILWTGKYEMAPFYKILLTLRKTNPALATDASYRRLPTNHDDAVLAYLRQKDGRKAVVLLNMSNRSQNFTITDAALAGNPLNVFKNEAEKIADSSSFKIEPWGYLLYDYR